LSPHQVRIPPTPEPLLFCRQQFPEPRIRLRCVKRLRVPFLVPYYRVGG
jgi:hypothetical protein